MSIRFFDSFGNASAGTHTPNTAGDDLNANWDGGNVFTVTEHEAATEGRRGYLTGTAGAGLRPIKSGGVAGEILLGFRFWLDDLATDRLIAQFEDQAGGTFGQIGFDATDDTLVYTIASSGDISASQVLKTTASLTVGWQYVEVRIRFSNTVGTVDWQIEGTPAGSGTSLDTILAGDPADLVGVIFVLDDTSDDWNALDRLADVYIADYADAFLGISEVWYQAADAVGSSADFTPSTGANHENVDEIGNDGDTTYNESAVPTDRDSFGHSGVIAGGNPHALQVIGIARSSVMRANIRLGVDSAGTTSIDSSREVDVGFNGVRGAIVTLDPDTAAPWDAAGVNAAETLVEVGA